jgi:tetratricopeptide (TPR) repeat protein
MRRTSRLLYHLTFAAALGFAQQPPAQPQDLGARDLLVHRIPPPGDFTSEVLVPRGYALVIGVGAYANLHPDDYLKYAESDAEAVYRVLISKEGGNIEPENVKKLIGKQATLANIREAIDNWLPSVANEQDRVIVYFAGHGVVEKGRGYIAPYDIDVKRVAQTAYPMDQLGTVLANKIKAHWKVLLTDACHSGKVTAETSDLAVYEAVTNLPRSFLTLTSSRERESSFEDPALAGGYGLYSYYLVQGWQGHADVDPADGIITADELIEYVRREVKAHARRKGHNQTPTERGDYPNDMILGFSAKRRGELAAAASKQPLVTGTLIIESNMDDVEVYLDDQLVGKVSPGKNLVLPGVSSGNHIVRGVRQGYDPSTREVIVVPGQSHTVTLRIQYARKVKDSARALYDKGLAIYSRRKSESDLRKAEGYFQQALKEDGKYSEAALLLCLTQQILHETVKAQANCRKAIEIDPDYVEARVHYGALLVESGDTSEAIRQLSAAVQRDPKNSQAYSHLAEAYYLANAFEKSEEAANKAIELSPRNSQAYLFRGDARRRMKRFEEAIEDYRQYLALDDFTAPLYQKLPVWLIGHGLSYRNAGQKRVYATQRSSAFYGLCLCEAELERPLRASEYCRKALAIDKEDPYTLYLLGTVYMDLFNRDNRRSYLVSARDSIERSLSMNPNIEFASEARANLKEIHEFLSLVR